MSETLRPVLVPFLYLHPLYYHCILHQPVQVFDRMEDGSIVLPVLALLSKIESVAYDPEPPSDMLCVLPFQNFVLPVSRPLSLNLQQILPCYRLRMFR